MFSGSRNRISEFARWAKRPAALLCLAIMGGCASPNTPPLVAMDREVDLERFMGDWYVIGSIPVTIPFLSDEGAHNAVES